MNNQEKSSQADPGNQFSMTQPMAQQLSMAHQLSGNGSHHMPLSMTQPLPMEALHMGLQRATQRGQHMGANNRVETLANDYSAWGVTPPPSPTYSGVSPFGTYQQFSPLPHHQMGHVAQHHQSYPHYPFSATAPDLSAALSMSPYGVSPQQAFSNSVNVGHLLPDHHGNYTNSVSTSNLAKSVQTQNSVGSAMQNPVWPPTSAEVSSVIDKELFGFGLDSHSQQANSYQPQFQQYYQQSQQQKPLQSYGSGIDQAFKSAQVSANNQKLMRSAEQDIMSLINNEKYVNRESKSLRPIMESSDEQSVRPKHARNTCEQEI